jgi:arylsulfatase A-like enzyme
VLTGRHPNRYGLFTWGNALRPQERTLAETLSEAGYRTGHFGKWHIGSMRADHPPSPGQQGYDEWYASPNFYENSPIMSHNGRRERLRGESSTATMSPALDFIENATENDQPFFATVWFAAPHTPHEAVAELRELYPDMPENHQNYLGEMTGLDRAMGALREHLRDLGIEGETVVWYCSDNGGRRPEASNAGLRDEKGSLYEGGIRVPAIIEWPGYVESRMSRVVTSTSDIYPTVLDLAGIDRPHPDRPLDGISLTPLLRGEMTARNQPLAFWDHPGNGILMRPKVIHNMHRYQQEGMEPQVTEPILRGPDRSYAETERDRPGPAALIDGRWKLHKRGDRYELYDLRRDPREQHNVLDEHPDRAERMKQTLHAWQESVIRSLKGEDYGS